MPPRSLPSPFATRLPRLFHSSAIRWHDSPKNHYETLQIPTNATPTEVKKSFYALSKTHHPDHNPSDPTASHRFVAISDAYATLGTPAKRQAYDREHIRTHHSPSPHAHGHHTPQGSYHSSGPAGGRAPSGLSRRRTQFRGPPPSFYRSGGWGEHSAKRRQAQDNGVFGAEAPPTTEGGMGYGQSPFEQQDVPHFDRKGHFRTHENQDRGRQRRRGPDRDYIPIDPPRGTLANFMFVGGVIGLGVLVPSLVFEKMTARVSKVGK